MYSEDEPAKFVKVKMIRRGRSVHHCIQCGNEIGLGDPSEYTKGMWADGPRTFWTCIHCVSIR